MALILNILPIPGLDGFGAIRPFLPAAWAPQIRKAEGLSMGLLLLAVFIVPGFSGQLFAASLRLSAALGVIPEFVGLGWRAFHFWR
jgi:Zn-dependent protease